MRAPWGACALATIVACGSEAPVVPPDADPCDGNSPPAAPNLTSSSFGRIDVVDADLVLTGDAYADPDGDPPAGREIEIWEVDADGALSDRAWVASVADPAAEVRLGDGQFVNGATALAPWQRYGARARDVDQHGACAQPGEWGALATFRADDGSTAVFDPDVVREVRLELTPATINALNAQAYPPGCVPFERAYYPGTLVFDGVRYEHVGVKTKGGCGSSQDLNGKPGFKISLDWDDPAVPGCPEERRIGGQKTLTLNAQVQDASQAHERLAYTLYREMGVPAPRAAPARVFVNDIYFGLYLHLESFNRRFLERNFVHPGGMMYEGTYWCDLYEGNLADDDSGCLTREFRADACDGAPQDGDDPLTYDPLRDFIDGLDALGDQDFYPAITALVDWDNYVSAWAVEAYADHWDSYNYQIVNNYRFYRDPGTGLWTMVPSGLDQTFINDGLEIPIFSPTGRIAARCVTEPDCKATFAAKLAEVRDLADAIDLRGMASQIAGQVLGELIVDPGRGYAAPDVAYWLAQLDDWLAARPQQVSNALTSQGF